MNDLRHPCEHWAEPISLAAAGCLPPDEEREVRGHIETCPGCRERFRQLTKLCAALVDAKLPADSPEDAVVERVMSTVAPDQSQRPLVRPRAEMIHPTLLTRTRDTWRWIMRSPVSRVASAIIFLLAVGGVALWFHGGGATPALADFLEPILEAKGVRCKMTTKMTALPPQMRFLPAKEQKELMEPTTITVMQLDATRIRYEVQGPGKYRQIAIYDKTQGKKLCMLPNAKQASVYDDSTSDGETASMGSMARFRAMLLDARDMRGVEGESLGKKEIDGRQVVGIRVRFPDGTMSVWGDPKTGLPVYIEAAVTAMPNFELTMSDFEFDVDMDESLFSIEPPPDYEVGNFFIGSPHVDPSTTEEKDLVEMFREYTRLSEGEFPAALDMLSVTGIVFLEFPSERNQRPGAREEVDKIQMKLQRGLMFSLVKLPKEVDAHYAGKGVSLGAADTPIYWYRPTGAETYRVIYADLSVQDADTPPAMPVRLPEQDLINTLRYCSELNDGVFPDSLELEPLIRIVAMSELSARNTEHSSEDSGADRQQEIQRITARKLLPGLNFTGSLTPQADMHYAGRGVSLGATDTPIFWYRPQDSKKYRVVYADLSVREADAAPDVPTARPLPVPLPEPGRPQGDCTIAVKVVAEATGKPVPDAHIFLFYTPTSHGMFVNTDQDGTYVFENIPTGPYSLKTINTPGFQDAYYDPEHKGGRSVRFSLKAGEQRRDIVLKLKEACRILGKVVDEDGKVPEDANQLSVSAWFKADRREGYENKYAVVNRSDCSYVIDGLSEKPAYVTVENQRAAKEGHGPPPIYYPGTFSRSKAKLVTFEKDRSVENVNITRRKEGGLAIAGTVRDEAGKPVPEAFVVVHPCDMYGNLATAYTDLEGHYQIQGLGEGEFQVNVDAVHRGLVRTRTPVHLDGKTKKTELNFTLRQGVTISGKLVDENGHDWVVARNLCGRAIVDNGAMRDGFALTNVDFRNKFRPVNCDGMARGWLYLGKGDYPDGEMIFPTRSTFIIQGVMPGHTTFQVEYPPQRIAKVLHAGQDILDSGIDTEPGQEIKDITIVIAEQEESPPSVSNAQPVPGPSRPTK